MRIALALLAALLPATAVRTEAPLHITAIDVEGGAAVLYVTPQGHSLLIDTGWEAGQGNPPAAPGVAPPPTSAQKIVAAAKAAHLSKIDYVLVTHYHADHVGGVAELAASFPIGTFLDHGVNRELPKDGGAAQPQSPAYFYPKYLAAIGSHPRRSLTPGTQIRIDDLVLTAIDGDGAVPPQPLPGGGAPGVGCATAQNEANDGGIENPKSLGVLLSYGKARILALGDTTWQVENKLVCPVNLIGPVDLMVADNHGSGNSSSQPFLDTLSPRMILFINGATKGADGETFDRVAQMPHKPVVWQLHVATRSPDKNAPDANIVNPTSMPDAHLPLEIAVEKTGAITVRNPRTGAAQRYAG
ncbi:ComEC/Rec2 family competence protein [Sphingomonas nostoxanthinifaciens]|uniref:ComEC/Rec2 family competence protein n=1 Tax=Sphingomonas nostoxanthinifaciens TaxID=2872652 RepID=UPI001CC20918|nr:MBL fold metallo-hydrolase [Sphingomonas nostoxanthinifaciens]UAK25216.1 MBL fold metallo-hydrolase [Sphingomonas nostoxanthinifaciens]